MTKQIKEALLKSIEHWHQNLDVLILNCLSGYKDLAKDVSIKSQDCALCALFHAHVNCYGCPIAKHTGLGGCDDTPYNAVMSWMYRYDFGVVSKNLSYEEGYQLISEELEFLYSLLPD